MSDTRGDARGKEMRMCGGNEQCGGEVLQCAKHNLGRNKDEGDGGRNV